MQSAIEKTLSVVENISGIFDNPTVKTKDHLVIVSDFTFYKVNIAGTATDDRYMSPATFEELYEKYYSFVFAEILKMRPNVQDAEDIAHEILLKFWLGPTNSGFRRHIRGYASMYNPKKAAFTTYLKRFISTRGIDEIKNITKHTYALVPVDIGDLFDETSSDSFIDFDTLQKSLDVVSYTQRPFDPDEAVESTVYHIARLLEEKYPKFGREDLSLLFTLLYNQATKGRTHLGNIRKAMGGISTSTLNRYMAKLRLALEEDEIAVFVDTLKSLRDINI